MFSSDLKRSIVIVIHDGLPVSRQSPGFLRIHLFFCPSGWCHAGKRLNVQKNEVQNSTDPKEYESDILAIGRIKDDPGNNYCHPDHILAEC
jgi:hypothetical protein